MIFDEMPTLLFILWWWHFSCLQIYSEEFLNIYFHEQTFFQIFVAKGDTCLFFWGKIAYEQYIQVSSTKTSSFLGINILIQKYFSEEWEQIHQFNFKRKTTEGNVACQKYFLNFTGINCPISFCYFFIFLVYETYSHLLWE